MAKQQMNSAFASSSNASTVVSSKKYDVFLSFRGEDTRKNFTSHLYEALMQKKVETYIDYRLKRGDEISPSLIKAIEDSIVSVVILSKNYACSKWCLEELSKIMECQKIQGQIVLPLFYNIDPSHVRKQTGSYKKAFAKLEGEPNYNKWKADLTEVANLAGWDSRGRDLIEILDLSKAEKLEGVCLKGCESVSELHASMSFLPNLRHLTINKCRGIESLNVHSKSLQRLYAIGCSSLKELLVTSEEMTRLHLSATSICAISSSIWHNRKLGFLTLSSYNNLDKLSDDSGMGSITTLDHYGCMQHNASELSFIQALFHNIGHFSSLKFLKLTHNNVESLPTNIKNLSSLTRLLLSGCRKLVSLPELPPSLTELYLDDCSKLVSLSQLPTSLEEVSARNCAFLDTNSTQRLVLQHMLWRLIPYFLNNPNECYIRYFIFPGDHEIDECDFCTTGSSITIPYLQLSSHLCGFIYCIILSKGISEGGLSCSVYQDGKEVGHDYNYFSRMNLIADHVLFSYVKRWHIFSNNLPFKLEFYFKDKNYQFQESIKECGVFPVYASECRLKLFGSSSKEIFESESITEISDNESHPKGIGVGGSNNENENEWEQFLNEITSSV